MSYDRTGYGNKDEKKNKKAQGWENMKNIGKDAVDAKSSGVSYGKYKAGIKPVFEDSEYAVNGTEFVRKSEGSSDDKKIVAFIK